jgi:cell division protein ZipA
MRLVSELRWALLIVGVVFFAALTVWELRRPRQARSGDPGPKASRAPESDLELPEMHAREPLAGRYPPLIEIPEDTGSFPVLSPAETPTALAASEELGSSVPEASESGLLEGEVPEPGVAEPEAAERAPEEEYTTGQAAATEQSAATETPALGFVIAQAASRGLPELPGSPAPLVEWPPDAERRVVALRLVATQPERFPGRSLRQALAAEGFVLGRFDIFHKGDEEQRAVLSAASLNRPGTFDSDTMDSQHFGGLSLFAVLPGPMSPPQAFEELVTTARSLNNRLCGVLQDEGGLPLTPSRIATLRERLTGGAHS